MAFFLALIAAVLFGLAVSGIYEQAWVYIASLVAGFLALVLGLQGRKRAAEGAGGRGTATTGAVIGGLLFVVQAGWLILDAVGVIEG